MSFNIYQLDNLDYDEAEDLLDDYINDAIVEFAESEFAKPYIEQHELGGDWIGQFIYFAYCYEGFTLPQMTKKEVELIMEELLPRKLTIFDESDAEDAIPELIEFWRYLKHQYKFRNADKIIKYLDTLTAKFPKMMVDPSRGGFAKSFMLMGHQAGFDMSDQESVLEFQEEYNKNIATNLQRGVSPQDVLQHFQAKSTEQQKITVNPTFEPRFKEITTITDDFCQKYLSDEYTQLSRRLTTVMLNEHPSVISKGKAKSWACGIVHALGMVNFLYDQNSQPYLSASELYEKFGVSSSTGSAKSKQIRDLLDITQMDLDWCLPSNLGKNPFVNLISTLSKMSDLLDI